MEAKKIVAATPKDEQLSESEAAPSIKMPAVKDEDKDSHGGQPSIKESTHDVLPEPVHFLKVRTDESPEPVNYLKVRTDVSPEPVHYLRVRKHVVTPEQCDFDENPDCDPDFDVSPERFSYSANRPPVLSRTGRIEAAKAKIAAGQVLIAEGAADMEAVAGETLSLEPGFKEQTGASKRVNYSKSGCEEDYPKRVKPKDSKAKK